ncbi:MAG TPA: hypothetical protein VFW19_05880 [Allosphingosinicella sp.]|nr:hypothetical protein [Allosphingosinicella sp.]
MFGFFCLIIGAGLLVRRIPEQPPEDGAPRQARITSIDFRVTHIDAFAVLSLRSDDGSIGRDDVPTGQLSCRVGDVVPVQKVGVFLRLAREACRRLSVAAGAARVTAAVKMRDANGN